MGFRNLLLKKNNFDYFFQKMGFCRFFDVAHLNTPPLSWNLVSTPPTFNTPLERATQNKNTFEELISLALFVFWQSGLEKRQKTEKIGILRNFSKKKFLFIKV